MEGRGAGGATQRACACVGEALVLVFSRFNGVAFVPTLTFSPPFPTPAPLIDSRLARIARL